MDNSKKADFVRKMSFKRLSLAKGGMVKRKKMDIGGLLGTAGGQGGTGFTTQAGTNAGQLSNSYNQVQSGLGTLNNLTNTLTPQAASAVNAQNTLAGQYAAQATGQGPNVAQNVLNQATGANVANQAALMAGQRGAGANPALIAREAAMQGATTQQQAAGQAATTQAEQQIAAEQAGAQLASNQIGQSENAAVAGNQAAQNEQGILQGANTASNNQQAGLANTEMQGQQGLIGGVMNGAGAIAGLSEGGEVHPKLEFVHKMTKLGLDHHDKSIKMADGGQVPGIAVPNVTINSPPVAFQPTAPAAQGGFTSGSNAGAAAMGNSLKHNPKNDKKPVAMGTSSDPTDANITGQNNPLVQSNQATVQAPGAADFSSKIAEMTAAHGGSVHHKFQGPHKSIIANYLMNSGGKVKALVSSGEGYLTPEKVNKVIHEGENPLKICEKFPGKAKVKGDSEKNDVIPRDLDDGGVVIDRENMMSPKKAALFVHKSVAKHRARGK